MVRKLLYGFVRGDAAYQFEGGRGIFNRINTVTLDNAPDKEATEDRFDATATTTRVGVDFKTQSVVQILEVKLKSISVVEAAMTQYVFVMPT